MGDEQVFGMSSGKQNSPKKPFNWDLFFSVICVTALAGLLGWWIYWINQPETYPITGFNQCIYKENTSACYSEIHFSCIDEDEDTVVIGTPLTAITVKKRTDGRDITSVVFSDVDRRPGNLAHDGQSATILVPTGEDVVIWERYLSEKRSDVERKKVVPRRVVPDLSPVPTESPINK